MLASKYKRNVDCIDVLCRGLRFPFVIGFPILAWGTVISSGAATGWHRDFLAGAFVAFLVATTFIEAKQMLELGLGHKSNR